MIYSSSDSGIVRQPAVTNIKVKTRYNYEATCSIETIEGVLARSAARHGLEVSYDTQPISAVLSQESGVVENLDAYAVKVLTYH